MISTAAASGGASDGAGCGEGEEDSESQRPGEGGAWEHSAKRNGQMENSRTLAEARTHRVLLPTAAFYGV